MARIHAKRKGRHGSTRPFLKESPKWVPLEPGEIVDLVVQMHGEGSTQAVIGTRLRDLHGVPDVTLATGKSIREILAEKKVAPAIPEDLSALMRKAVALQVHLKIHPKDHSNHRGLQLAEAKIRRLARYYKENGVLPPEWDYSRQAAELQVK